MIHYPSAATFPLCDRIEQRLRNKKGAPKYQDFHFKFLQIASKWKYDDEKIVRFLETKNHCVRCWAPVASEFRERSTGWKFKTVRSEQFPEGKSVRMCEDCAGICDNCQCGELHNACRESHEDEKEAIFCDGCRYWFCDDGVCQDANFQHPLRQRTCINCCMEYYLTQELVGPCLREHLPLPSVLVALCLSFVRYKKQK